MTPSFAQDLVDRSRRLARRAAHSRRLPLFGRLRDWKRRRDKRRYRVPRRSVTFNEKVRYKMAKDRRPVLHLFADKVAVRDYVARTAGAGLLTEVYLVTDDPDDIREDRLPHELALKASHGSGACVLVAEHASLDTELPGPPAGWMRALVHPTRVDWSRLRNLATEWLALRYWEWAYAEVPPRIIAEELLLEEGRLPTEFKFFVFDGRVRMVQVVLGRYYGPHIRTLYTPEWELIPVDYGGPRGPKVERPVALDEMIAIASQLAAPVDFLHVDLYCIGERIVFGELTNYPLAGNTPFVPESFDRELGSCWSQPKRYR